MKPSIANRICQQLSSLHEKHNIYSVLLQLDSVDGKHTSNRYRGKSIANVCGDVTQIEDDGIKIRHAYMSVGYEYNSLGHFVHSEFEYTSLFDD
jgi:hypothetical protein